MAVFSTNIQKFSDFAYSITAAGPTEAFESPLFNFVTFQLAGTFVGSIQIEGSNDRVNWRALPNFQLDTASPVLSTSSRTSVGIFGAQTLCEFIRFNITAFTSGTMLLTGGFSTEQVSQDALSNNAFSIAALPTGNNQIGTVVPSVDSTGSLGNTISAGRITSGASGFIKASAARFYGFDLLNTNAAIRYLQIYNKASAGVPGTDTPVYTIPLAASQNKVQQFMFPARMATGLAWAITTDAPGATIGAALDVVGTIHFN